MKCKCGQSLKMRLNIGTRFLASVTETVLRNASVVETGRGTPPVIPSVPWGPRVCVLVPVTFSERAHRFFG